MPGRKSVASVSTYCMVPLRSILIASRIMRPLGAVSMPTGVSGRLVAALPPAAAPMRGGAAMTACTTPVPAW